MLVGDASLSPCTCHLAYFSCWSGRASLVAARRQAQARLWTMNYELYELSDSMRSRLGMWLPKPGADLVAMEAASARPFLSGLLPVLVHIYIYKRSVTNSSPHPRTDPGSQRPVFPVDGLPWWSTIQVLSEVDVHLLQWTCHWFSPGRHRGRTRC